MSRAAPRHLAWLIAAILPVLVSGIVLAGGDGVEQTVAPERRWTVEEVLVDGSVVPVVDGRPVTGGVVDRSYGLAALDPVFDPIDDDGLATAKIFSNETGRTWWLSLESQAMARSPRGPEAGSLIEFEQLHGFQKTQEQATLRLVFTKAFIDALDHNGALMQTECITAGSDDHELCTGAMWGNLDVRVHAWTQDGSLSFQSKGGAYLEGQQGDWTDHINLDSQFGYGDLWTEAAFELNTDVDDDGGLHARAHLQAPTAVDIPLNGPFFSEVDVGEVFALQINAEIETYNRRGRESWLAVYLRDPVESGGTGAAGAMMELSGLTPTNDFPREPPPEVFPAPAPCAAPDPAAGALRLEVAEPRVLEMHGARWHGVVSRSGGSRGEVSAMLAAQDGTATAGSDFEPMQTFVAFADGDAAPRSVSLRVVSDGVIEPAETLRLALDEPGGARRSMTSPASSSRSSMTMRRSRRPRRSRSAAPWPA
jgi:hypothetical protein